MRQHGLFAKLARTACGVVLALCWPLTTVHAQDAKPAAKLDSSADLELLRASAVAFEKAFNAEDPASIGALFIENAEAVDDAGDIYEGRAAIVARFEELFKEYPKAKIAIDVTSLRTLSPDIAVEDGLSTTTLDPSESGARSPYSVVHVKRDGKWLMASVREFPVELTEATAHEQLEQLGWLVGNWVDEGSEGRVETTCEWSEDGNYLLQTYVVKSRIGGTMKGSQRIAWDPLRRTIRSWAFDQSGAFTEATWTPLEDAWIVKAEGVTPDGRSVSVTRYVSSLDNDSYQIDSTGLVVGSEELPAATVRVVRRPPTPAE